MFALGEPAGSTQRSDPLAPTAEEIERILHARLRVMAMGETLDVSPAIRALIEDGIPQLAQLASAGECDSSHTTGSDSIRGERVLTRFFKDVPRELKW